MYVHMQKHYYQFDEDDDTKIGLKDKTVCIYVYDLQA